MHNLLTTLLLSLSLTAAVYYLCAIFSACDLFSKRTSKPSSFLPPISILKSIRGVDYDSYETLASFCRQDYPVYQILFGVHEPQDPGVGVVQRLIRDFPGLDIRLVHCDQVSGTNPKVSNLIQMEIQARYPILLVSDSDIYVEPDCLRQVVGPLRDPSVGAVTCMSRSRTKGFASVIEGLRISTEFCAGVLVARKLGGIKFGLGSAMALRREALGAIGGFAAIGDYLADDFQLGYLIAKAGYQVRLSPYVVEHRFSRIGLGDMVRRQIRWARGIRISRPLSYAGLLLTQGVPMSLFFLMSRAFASIGWAVLGLTWATRLAMAGIVGAIYLNDPAAKKFLWLVPLQDLISFTVWCACFFGDTVEWRGERFRLTPAGKLIPLNVKLSVAYLQETVSLPKEKVVMG